MLSVEAANWVSCTMLSPWYQMTSIGADPEKVQVRTTLWPGATTTSWSRWINTGGSPTESESVILK